MADVRDWGRFIRGRWNWTAFGYEDGFPRNSQFTDVDSSVEFDDRRLVIECKGWDGDGIIPSIYGDKSTGQRMHLRDEAKLGKTVFVLYGCGVCNDPYALHILGPSKHDDLFVDWRGLDRPERRKLLKRAIDEALGLEASGAA
jgi:hypothetical protein